MKPEKHSLREQKNDFCTAAFTEGEKNSIIKTTVINKDKSHSYCISRCASRFMDGFIRIECNIFSCRCFHLSTAMIIDPVNLH